MGELADTARWISRHLLARVATLPGVEAVSLARNTPFSGAVWTRSATLDGYQPQLLDGLPCLGGFVELDVGVAQADVSEREAWIAAQRLMKRARRFDPDVGVEIREALVVKPLRFSRLRRHRVMRPANSGAHRDRPLK